MSNRILVSGLLVALLGAWICFGISLKGRRQTTTDEIIREAGYPSEEHKIQTEDGYILTVFRIPHDNSKKQGPKPVILLQHGLTGTSDQFVQLGSEKSLAFFLADKGFDVWMGNIIGNRYSQQNVHYNISDPIFWDFSWDEMAYFDLPATISYILNNTKQEKIFYVGHSMGSNILMALLTRRPEFQSRIELAFVLAPAVYVAEGRSIVFTFFCKYVAPLILKTRDPNALLPVGFNNFQTWFAPQCSSDNQLMNSICKLAYTLTNGPTTDVLQETLTSFFYLNPSQASAKSLAHFGQAISSGIFKAYDYGEKGNLKRYGSPESTNYNLSKIQIPVAIMYSDSDYIVPPPDAHKLCVSLPKVIAFHRIPLKTFNHMDFLYGESARELVYEEMFKIISNSKNGLKIKVECTKTEFN